MLSVYSPEHLWDNHATHSVSSIEHVVASNKVVSTRKNARSAHVEIPRVERVRMMEGVKEGMEAKTSKHVFIFLIPRRLSLFDGCARLSCMLAPSRTHRVHDRSAGVKVPLVMGGAFRWTPHFPCMSSFNSEDLPRIPWK